MPERDTNPSAAQTWLAWHRTEQGLTQADMAELTGIPLATYRKLERGEIENPGIRLLSNCAVVLNTSVFDLVEIKWQRWFPLSEKRKRPPTAATLEARKQPKRWPSLKSPALPDWKINRHRTR